MRNEGLGSEFCVNESQAHTVEMNRCQDVLYCHLNRSWGVNEGQEGFPPHGHHRMVDEVCYSCLFLKHPTQTTAKSERLKAKVH